MQYQNKSKYHSKICVYDGMKFHSQKEGEYYLYLKSLLKNKKIKNLELQKEYILQDKFKINGKTQRKISYKADFTYFSLEDNKLHVVDVKGFKTEIYKLKKKLFEYKYGIEIEEV